MKKDINEGTDNRNSASQDVLMDRVNQAFDKMAENVRGMIEENAVKKKNR
ncbi:hypothetical protein QUF73_06740 [Cytobacillus sp. NJ13]|nr:hypothetical protein [Cytobacillus sp. NJ13]